MKKIIAVAFASTAALALAACGTSDTAGEEATAESVEMPAEEAVPATDPMAATPAAADPMATPAADAMATPAADASAAANAAGDAADAAAKAADAAATDAEKKM
jgi:hypothetical protein